MEKQSGKVVEDGTYSRMKFRVQRFRVLWD